LLHRELVIQRLEGRSAQMYRPPIAEPSSASSRLELSPPSLPVGVAIEELGIPSIVLDPAELGEPVRLALRGQGRLARGQAAVHLALRRIDERPGQAALDLTLAGRPAILDIKGEVGDPRGLLAGELLGRQDRPPLAVAFAGRGPIADWHGHLEARLGELL